MTKYRKHGVCCSNGTTRLPLEHSCLIVLVVLGVYPVFKITGMKSILYIVSGLG